MFIDVFAALLAWGAAIAWVLTGGDKLPAGWDHLRKDSTPTRNPASTQTSP